MKTFTRKEILNNAIEEIRTYLRIYEKNNELIFIHEADKYPTLLAELKIITWEKAYLMSEIIHNIAFNYDIKKGR